MPKQNLELTVKKEGKDRYKWNENVEKAAVHICLFVIIIEDED